MEYSFIPGNYGLESKFSKLFSATINGTKIPCNVNEQCHRETYRFTSGDNVFILIDKFFSFK